MGWLFHIKYGFQKGSHKILKKYKIHTIRKDIKNLKYVKTIKMYKILTQIHLNYKIKKITLRWPFSRFAESRGFRGGNENLWEIVASSPFLGPSLARSREAHFAYPNRRAFSQATERQVFYYPKITKLLCLQRCVACEVLVNLNYSTEVHFALFYWFKSRTWQRKSNRACAKVTWKPGKQQTWRLILRWRKEHSGLHSRGWSDSETYYWNGPGFKPFTLSILLIQICKC